MRSVNKKRHKKRRSTQIPTPSAHALGCQHLRQKPPVVSALRTKRFEIELVHTKANERGGGIGVRASSVTKAIEGKSDPTQGPSEANTRYHRRTAQAVGVLSLDLAMPHHDERTRLRDQVNDVRGCLGNGPNGPRTNAKYLPLLKSFYVFTKVDPGFRSSRLTCFLSKSSFRFLYGHQKNSTSENP